MMMNDFDDIFEPIPAKPIDDSTHPIIAELIEERNRSIPLPKGRKVMIIGSDQRKTLVEAVDRVIMTHPDQIIQPDQPIPVIHKWHPDNYCSDCGLIRTENNERRRCDPKPIPEVPDDGIDPFKDIRPLFQMNDHIDIDENWYRGRKLFITNIDHKSGIVMEDELENEKGNKWANMKICFPWEATRHYVLKGTMKVRK